MCREGVTVFYKASSPHNIAHYVFYAKNLIFLVQWLALSDVFRLYSFKLKKIGGSDHGLAQEFYLPQGTEENNEKLSHDHWSLGSSLGINHNIWFLRNQVITLQ